MAETCYNFEVELEPPDRWTLGYGEYVDHPYRVTCKDCGAVHADTEHHDTGERAAQRWIESHREPFVRVDVVSVERGTLR